jgi:hypothetical protein
LRVAVTCPPAELEARRQRDEALLQTVVQTTLDRSAICVGRAYESCS